jgi:hypothetical protein
VNRVILFFAVTSLLCGGGSATAGPIQTFDLTWSGAQFGNNATATGQITLDLGQVNNPGSTFQSGNPFVQAFTITVSGASAGNGTFTFNQFNGSPTLGGFLMNIAAPGVNFSQNLVGQASFLDFNIFPDGISNLPPRGTSPFVITTNIDNGGGGSSLVLTSFVPAAAVPEPTTLALFGLGTLTAGYFGLRRRKPDVA